MEGLHCPSCVCAVPKRREIYRFLIKTKLTLFCLYNRDNYKVKKKYMIFIEINELYLKYWGGCFVQL